MGLVDILDDDILITNDSEDVNEYNKRYKLNKDNWLVYEYLIINIYKETWFNIM